MLCSLYVFVYGDYKLLGVYPDIKSAQRVIKYKRKKGKRFKIKTFDTKERIYEKNGEKLKVIK